MRYIPYVVEDMILSLNITIIMIVTFGYHCVRACFARATLMMRERVKRILLFKRERPRRSAGMPAERKRTAAISRFVTECIRYDSGDACMLRASARYVLCARAITRIPFPFRYILRLGQWLVSGLSPFAPLDSICQTETTLDQ